MTHNEQSRRDTVKDYRPQIVRPIKYKPKADEQVLYFVNRKPVIVRRKNAQVSKDNRSDYQKRVDQKTTVYAKQKHEQQRNYEEATKGVEAITRLVSPSTYVGAAARSLTGDGTFGSNLTSGTGFNDTAANIAFDVASPFILKTGLNAGSEFLQNLNKYKLKIPINKNLYYRQINGFDAINDANNSGMITRPYAGDYNFPYFTKGSLYSDQNGAFNYGRNQIVIESKPGQQFEYVKDGIHEINPNMEINVGDSATPIVKNDIGTAYNSAPSENFTYWKRGDGFLSKYFFKQHQFRPFQQEKIVSRSSYGKPIAEGSESEVFENPSNKYTVLKEYSGGFRNNLNGMRDELIRRNSVPGAVPTKIEGITLDGYPVLSQPIVQAYPEGTKWTYNMAKDVINLLRRTGYTRGLHEVVPNNGVWKLVDLSPQNIGYLNGDVRLIDVPPYKL